VRLEAGDILLMSTDGFHDCLKDDDLSVLSKSENPDRALERLADTAVARGSRDDLTALLIAVEPDDVEEIPVELGDFPELEKREMAEAVKARAARAGGVKGTAGKGLGGLGSGFGAAARSAVRWILLEAVLFLAFLLGALFLAYALDRLVPILHRQEALFSVYGLRVTLTMAIILFLAAMGYLYLLYRRMK
jgi:hypothetical protein